MAELNVMPLFTDAWTGDVADLPNELYGAYTRLIVRWWREGAMPEENERKLARWSGLSTTDFDDLKDFLTHTERGWIQKKLMKTYAATLEKSVKAQKSADARHKRANAPETYEERISAGYSDRLPPDMLSVIRNPESIVEGSYEPSPQKKKINKKRKGEGASPPNSPSTLQLVEPSDPACRLVIDRLAVKHARAKLAGYFNFGDRSALHIDGEVLVIDCASANLADRLDQRLGGDLNAICGQGGWRVSVKLDQQAA